MGTAHGRMCTEWDGNLKLIVPCETGSCICSFVVVNDTKLNSSDALLKSSVLHLLSVTKLFF